MDEKDFQNLFGDSNSEEGEDTEKRKSLFEFPKFSDKPAEDAYVPVYDLVGLNGYYVSRNVDAMLEKVYSNFPEIDRKTYTECCDYSAPFYLAEFLNVIHYLRENQKEYHQEIINNLLRHHAIGFYSQDVKCPMLKDGECLIFPVRSFNCRVYDAANSESYEDLQYENDLSLMNTHKAIVFDKTINFGGVRISGKDFYRTASECMSKKTEEKVSSQDLYELKKDVLEANSHFLETGNIRHKVEDDYILHFLSQHFMRLFFSEEEIDRQRIIIISQYEKTKDLSVIDKYYSKNDEIYNFFQKK